MTRLNDGLDVTEIKQPLLHVVIPAYGDSPFLASTISSAISAVNGSTLITVLDDASPGNQVELISNQFSPRVQYSRNETNLGLAANFLHAFATSTAKFTIVLGSDDQMLPGYELQLSRALQNFPNATVVHPEVEVINALGAPFLPLVDRIKSIVRGRASAHQTISSRTLCNKLFVGNFMYFPSIAWRTEVLRSLDWELAYKQAVDLDLLFKLVVTGEQFVFTSDRVFRYRRHKDSVSSILARDETRLLEELAVHWTSRSALPGSGWSTTRFLAQMAPTVRIHSIIFGLKRIPKDPIKGFLHTIRSLMPIKPLTQQSTDLEFRQCF
jgi:glycosyltransferase involved in cell wall biosynthesis